MIAGVDPDGLTGTLVHEVAAMAEAQGKVPPRHQWIDEYRETAMADAWEGCAAL